MSKSEKKMAFNRTIGFGVLLTLSIQTASGLIWAGAAEARIQAAEVQLSERAPALERLAVMEGQMTVILSSLDRIERQVMANAIDNNPKHEDR